MANNRRIDAKTGKLPWGPVNQTLPRLHTVFMLCARDGVYVLLDKDAYEAYGYLLLTGEKMWGPVKLPCNAMSHIWVAGDIAYGKVFIWDYGGYVNCLNLKTGELLWTFTRGSAGYDTPYGTYMIWGYGTHSIADGKLFLFEGKITETLITATPEVTSAGSSVLIKGSVMDISPGAKQAEWLNGSRRVSPVVDDGDMKAWMEYVYMQQPRPEEAKGVKVELYATKEGGGHA